MTWLLVVLALICGLLLLLFAGVGFGKELMAAIGALMVAYCVAVLALWRAVFGKDNNNQ